MRSFILAAGLAVALAPAAALAGPLEIRFCPAAQARPYPLESRRDLQGLILQNVAVIDTGASPAEIQEIDIDLMRGGEAIDTRRLKGADLEKAGKRGAAIQGSGMLSSIGFEFCGDKMIGPGIKLGGPALGSHEALLIFQQGFAYQGPRDAVRVRVKASAAGAPADVDASLPIVAGVSRTAFRFPLKGTWFVAVGPTLHTGHRWALPEEFAFDIARIGEGNASHKGDGTRFADYFAYGAEVLAAAAGKVVAAEGGTAEDPAALRRPGESLEAYGDRVGQLQDALIAKGHAALAGDYVMIDHGGGEYSLYAHLRPGSVKVKPGDDAVKAGQSIAQLGSSGNSTEPHLHFQVCDAPDPLACAGIPIKFQGVSLPFADYPRPLQSGDIVVAP